MECSTVLGPRSAAGKLSFARRPRLGAFGDRGPSLDPFGRPRLRGGGGGGLLLGFSSRSDVGTMVAVVDQFLDRLQMLNAMPLSAIIAALDGQWDVGLNQDEL